ncbi:MAG: hypothetical protein ABIJ56_10535 [Pseudomonadota bacterium]
MFNSPKCWGNNYQGAPGNGEYSNDPNPTPVSVLDLTNAVDIDGGGYFTCALLASGGVKCWGMNEQGELGDSTFTMKTTAVYVFGMTSGVSAVSAGEFHACARLDTGGARCWGWDLSGQITAFFQGYPSPVACN